MTSNQQDRLTKASIWAAALTTAVMAWLGFMNTPAWLQWLGYGASALSIGAAIMVHDGPRRWIAGMALKLSKLALRLAEYLESFDYPAP